MSREDVRREIVNRMGNNSTSSEESQTSEVDVALFNLKCTECGSINGQEPRPVNCPPIGQICEDCGDIQTHELVRVSDVRSLKD